MSRFPEKLDLFGVGVTPTTYDDSVALILDAAAAGQSAVVDYMPVHGLVLASEDLRFREISASFDMACPDGQPVRWALNRFYETALSDTVCGSNSLLKVCEGAAGRKIPVYFYGSTDAVLDSLQRNLLQAFPDLQIAGLEAPPFRALTAEEEAAMVTRVNGSGAGIMFIGLGCPKQEYFAVRHKGRILMPMLCVGAAFDFHAGAVNRSPAWMSRYGVEWLFRLCKEPRRLWKRYFYYNSRYLFLFLKRLLAGDISR